MSLVQRLHRNAQMADSGQQGETAADSIPIAGEAAVEPRKEHDVSSTVDESAASEQSTVVEQEGHAQLERVVEEDAVETQANDDLITGDGGVGDQGAKPTSDQNTGGDDPGTEAMSGLPAADEAAQEEDLAAGEEAGGMDGPSMARESAASGEGSSEAKYDSVMVKDEMAKNYGTSVDNGDVKSEGDVARDEGDAVKSEGDAVKSEGDAVKAEGDAVKAEGDAVKAEGDVTRDESDAVKAEGDVARDEGKVAISEGGVVKDEGDVTKDKGVSEPVVEEELGLSREELLAHLREALPTQEQLKARNAQYQHKIAEYLAKKKTEEKHDPTRSVTDQEQRYVKCMYALEALHQEYSALAEKQCEEEAELVAKSQHFLGLVDQQRKEDLMLCKQKSLASVYTRTGRRMTVQEFEQLAAEDQKGEGIVVQARLENIRLSTSIAKKEALIRKKEELGDGLHVIDFEQLKIDNVNLNEKIEERNEDLVKLRKKITGTVQVLTHVKEKLQFVQAENAEKKERLAALEQSVSLKRDRLTRLKQARDALRMDNIKLRHQGGLVGHMDLLRDFEEQVDKNDMVASVIQSRQQQQSEVLLACNRLQRKEATAAAWVQRDMV